LRREEVGKRSELIYSYASKYNAHKDQLREYYRLKDQEHLSFAPVINPKSQQMV
jgi:hypothetical protein